VYEPKVADKNTPYWWEAAPVMPAIIQGYGSLDRMAWWRASH
jgi:hypothetical protein